MTAGRIGRAFERARQEGRMTFVPYLTAGDPDLETTERFVVGLAEAGADVVELGVPFSDPLADGPVNQRAAERALASGTSLADVLTLVGRLRARTEVALVVFSYFNPILRFGLSAFAEQAAGVGVDGVLVTDLPPEESADYRRELAAHGLDTIFLATPTSDDRRLQAIAEASRGFVYAVPRTGVTGAQSRMDEAVRTMLRRIRRHTRLPVAVGFGISSAAQVEFLKGRADGFVVGSALVDRLSEGGVPAALELAGELVVAAR